MESSVIYIQKYIRGFLSRQKVKKMLLSDMGQRSTMKEKAYLKNSINQMLTAISNLGGASTKISAALMGYKVRKVSKEFKHLRESFCHINKMEKAALKIQSYWRQYWAKLRLMEESSLLMQMQDKIDGARRFVVSSCQGNISNERMEKSNFGGVTMNIILEGLNENLMDENSEHESLDIHNGPSGCLNIGVNNVVDELEINFHDREAKLEVTKNVSTEHSGNIVPTFHLISSEQSGTDEATEVIKRDSNDEPVKLSINKDIASDATEDIVLQSKHGKNYHKNFSFSSFSQVASKIPLDIFFHHISPQNPLSLSDYYSITSKKKEENQKVNKLKMLSQKFNKSNFYSISRSENSPKNSNQNKMNHYISSPINSPSKRINVKYSHHSSFIPSPVFHKASNDTPALLSYKKKSNSTKQQTHFRILKKMFVDNTKNVNQIIPNKASNIILPSTLKYNLSNQPANYNDKLKSSRKTPHHPSSTRLVPIKFPPKAIDNAESVKEIKKNKTKKKKKTNGTVNETANLKPQKTEQISLLTPQNKAKKSFKHSARQLRNVISNENTTNILLNSQIEIEPNIDECDQNKHRSILLNSSRELSHSWKTVEHGEDNNIIEALQASLLDEKPDIYTRQYPSQPSEQGEIFKIKQGAHEDISFGNVLFDELWEAQPCIDDLYNMFSIN